MKTPIKITVTVTDNDLKKIAEYPIVVEKATDIRRAHELVSKFLWRDYWVKFTWNDGIDIIYGHPEALKKDVDKMKNDPEKSEQIDTKFFPQKQPF